MVQMSWWVHTKRPHQVNSTHINSIRLDFFFYGDIMTTAQTTETTTETTETTEQPAVELQHQKLTAEQEIQTLRNVHTFLSNYDRVPGSLTNQWSQVLDAIALVANSIIAKAAETTTEASADTTPTETQTQ